MSHPIAFARSRQKDSPRCGAASGANLGRFATRLRAPLLTRGSAPCYDALHPGDANRRRDLRLRSAYAWGGMARAASGDVQSSGGPMADLLVWDSSCRVGVEEFDEAHQHLFAIGNNLIRAVLEGHALEVIRPVIDELIDYTEQHFRAEEALMRRADYPGYEAHRAEHRAALQEPLHRRRSEALGSLPVSHRVDPAPREGNGRGLQRPPAATCRALGRQVRRGTIARRRAGGPRPGAPQTAPLQRASSPCRRRCRSVERPHRSCPSSRCRSRC